MLGCPLASVRRTTEAVFTRAQESKQSVVTIDLAKMQSELSSHADLYAPREPPDWDCGYHFFDYTLDGTAQAERDAGARVVFDPVNQISRARNTGARAARGRFLVFEDADTLVPAPLLHEALEVLASGRAGGGGGPRGRWATARRRQPWTPTWSS